MIKEIEVTIDASTDVNRTLEIVA